MRAAKYEGSDNIRAITRLFGCEPTLREVNGIVEVAQTRADVVNSSPTAYFHSLSFRFFFRLRRRHKPPRLREKL